MLRFSMRLIINGHPRDFAELSAGSTLEQLIAELQLKGDRVAVEQNGEIVPRSQWPSARLSEADKLELVHFVGGGFDRRHGSAPDFEQNVCL